MIHLNYEKTTADVTGAVGGIFSCELVDITEWTSVYIRGEKIRKESNETFEFVLKSDGTWTLKGNSSHQIMRHEINKMDALTTISLALEHISIVCSDQDIFACGVTSNGKTEEEFGEVLVEGQPSSEVTLVIPVQVIEGEVLSISASWKAGYPQPSGNISWHQLRVNETIPGILPAAEMSWTLKTNKDTCETIIDSFAKFTPDLQFNGTDITARADMRGSKLQVAPAREVINVVPANYCDGFYNDTTTSHPYTCEKFVRCMPGKMLIYACPKDTCFNLDNSQCD